MNVALEVTNVYDTTNLPVYWRFNNHDNSETVIYSALRPAGLTYTIDGPVSAEHEGVYEAYYQNERDLGRHSIMRLIVRGKNTFLNVAHAIYHVLTQNPTGC